MAKRKRLEAWANEYHDGSDTYLSEADAQRYASHFGGASRVAVRLVECDESETVISKAELRALRAVAKAADTLIQTKGLSFDSLVAVVERLKGTKR